MIIFYMYDDDGCRSKQPKGGAGNKSGSGGTPPGEWNKTGGGSSLAPPTATISPPSPHALGERAVSDASESQSSDRSRSGTTGEGRPGWWRGKEGNHKLQESVERMGNE